MDSVYGAQLNVWSQKRASVTRVAGGRKFKLGGGGEQKVSYKIVDWLEVGPESELRKPPKIKFA